MSNARLMHAIQKNGARLREPRFHLPFGTRPNALSSRS